MATILKNNFHQSFDKGDTSSQTAKVGRKQQNHADLARRIGENFYNKYVRGRTELEKESKIDKQVFDEFKAELPPREISENLETMPTLMRDWVKHLDDNFLLIVLENMDARTRSETALAIENRARLSDNQYLSVIHSINFHTFKFITAVRPDASFCRILDTN